MSKLLSKPEYEKWIASTRDERMAWWREARFGMFIHYGLYSQMGRHEWAMTQENIPISEYEKLASTFAPKPGAPREWAALAKKAGMKYMVMTSRHHEGFSLWDSKVNPYNSVNYGPKRDIVREFVDACREYDLRIGFYTTLMDWHHPDSWTCVNDAEARKRFLDYIEALNTELLTNYGKIDILWYDVPAPFESWEGWDSVSRNQRMRALQPHIIINDRSRLPEDFGTPEEHVTAESRDWEACMTFNGISWGYVDESQTAPYAYNAQRIIRMLNTCANGGGNLLLNVGPRPDGTVPDDAKEPLAKVGEWLKENGEAVYGKVVRPGGDWTTRSFGGNGLCGASMKGNTVYLWNWIWPRGGSMGIGGYMTAPKRVYLMKDGTPIDFEFKGHRIILKNLPEQSPDKIANVAIIAMEFEEKPKYMFASYYPQLHVGYDVTDEKI
ncbi:MAG: alpha-L-fucosidase [Christensenellales bacterium]|jgi:alpha-L-fucosidase